MHRIAELIQRQLKLSVFVPLLLLALGTTWFGLFWSVNHFGQLSNGLPFMDMQPWLTAELLFEQIRSYGNEAVEFYLLWSAFDYAWPFITFTTMLFITAWLFRYLPETWQAWPRTSASYFSSTDCQQNLAGWLNPRWFCTA
jgi:hypothetical protein